MKATVLLRKEVIIPVAVVTGVGLLGYTFYKYISNPETPLIEDLSLPLALECEYNDFRVTYSEADPEASDYLHELDLPENLFHFNSNFVSFILTRLPERLGRALVIGSSVGALAFDLSQYFTEVKGIEKSFSKVVKSFQLQNGVNLKYYFPLEGSYRTSKITLDVAKILNKFRSATRNIEPLENVQIVNADPAGRLSGTIGLFQVIVLFLKSLSNLEDLASVLTRLPSFVEPGGFLFIVSNSDWTRYTNSHVGFGLPDVTTTFGFMQTLLQEHFDLVITKNMSEARPMSLQSFSIHNNRISVWSRNNVAPYHKLSKTSF